VESEDRKKDFTFIGQAQEVYSVAISPDSKTLVSGSFDQKITSWNLRKNEFIRTFFYLNSPYSHSGFVTRLPSAGWKIIASGSADKTIRLWNGYGGKLIRTINGHSDAVLSVAISPDSQTIASGSADKTIRLWNLIGGQQHHILAGHSGWVNSVAFSPMERLSLVEVETPQSSSGISKLEN
jgi:WD40 repeat protein